MLGFYERVVDQCIMPFCVNYECMMFLRVHYEQVCYTFTSTLQVYYVFTRTLPVYYTFTSIHYECTRFPEENHEPWPLTITLTMGKKQLQINRLRKLNHARMQKFRKDFTKYTHYSDLIDMSQKLQAAGIVECLSYLKADRNKSPTKSFSNSASKQELHRRSLHVEFPNFF